MKLFLEPLAKADIRAAFEFYEQRRDGLGRQFKARLQRAFTLIRDNPRISRD